MNAILTLRYISPTRILEAQVEVAPLAALLAALGGLVANLAVLILGGLTFILFLLSSPDFAMVSIALFGLALACLAEWHVLNALHRLHQLAATPTPAWAMAGA
jgi:hypothetical protein